MEKMKTYSPIFLISMIFGIIFSYLCCCFIGYIYCVAFGKNLGEELMLIFVGVPAIIYCIIVLIGIIIVIIKTCVTTYLNMTKYNNLTDADVYEKTYSCECDPITNVVTNEDVYEKSYLFKPIA